VSQATYKTNKLVNDNQASSIKKKWSHWSFVGQPENMSSKVSNRTTRASLGSKENEKVKTAKGKYPKSCSNNQETIPIGFTFISIIIIIS
jgi:hypothetical protein